jgi:hypothetical protein
VLAGAGGKLGQLPKLWRRLLLLLLAELLVGAISREPLRLLLGLLLLGEARVGAGAPAPM